MIKKKLIDLLKGNRFIYNIYYYTMSCILSILGFIIKANKKEILFLCYGGRKYGDNIKPIYEKLLKDKRFSKWRFVWAFRKPDQIELPENSRSIKCKVDSFCFYFYALRSKCWITNVSMQRGLNFKNKGTLYVNTWHGVPLKLIGEDIRKGSSFKINKTEEFDLILSEGIYDARISETAFKVNPSQVKITGYPRNDVMFINPKVAEKRVHDFLKIGYEKKIILYAPTFRDYNKNSWDGFTFDMRLSPKKFNKLLGDEYVLLVREHGMIENNSNSRFGYMDVTTYPNVEDLLVAADILITDYSGIMFDYSLLEKPIICFIYDIEKYKDKRGFYVDLETFLPFKKCYTEDELYKIIKNLDYENACHLSKEFKEKCGLIENNATEKAVDAIYEALSIR